MSEVIIIQPGGGESLSSGTSQRHDMHARD